MSMPIRLHNTLKSAQTTPDVSFVCCSKYVGRSESFAAFPGGQREALSFIPLESCSPANATGMSSLCSQQSPSQLNQQQAWLLCTARNVFWLTLDGVF